MYVHVYVIIFILCDAFTTPHKLTSSALRVRATSGPCLGGCRRALQVVAEALAVIPSSPHLAPRHLGRRLILQRHSDEQSAFTSLECQRVGRNG